MRRTTWFRIGPIILSLFIVLLIVVMPAFQAQAAAATGGTITYVGDYTIHTFTTSGTFIVTTSGNFEYLVVAGGGGGGSHYNSAASGGGGAGGVRSGTLSLNTGSYTITVGDGGAVNTNGNDSIFSTITSTGGGAGAATTTPETDIGNNGGSGGGGEGGITGAPTTYGNGNTPSTNPSQGYHGGSGYSTTTSTQRAGGGGGGAGAVGNNASSGTGGNGGNGVSSSITGSSLYYGGGGAGESGNNPTGNGTGGIGGGGNVTVAGTANTGGGGGSVAAGGSGIVIIRYLTESTPTDTLFTSTPSNTPTDTATFTSTFTPTNTLTPTNTRTPTNTATPLPFFVSVTPTATVATATPVPASTATSVATPTITATPQAVIWAPGTVDVGTDIQNAMGALLFANPPPGWQTNIYAATDATNRTGVWAISLVNLVGVSSPYTDWNVIDNGTWIGSVTCSEADAVWTCIYYDPPPLSVSQQAYGGAYGLMFPWKPGYSAIYGPPSTDSCSTSGDVGGGIHCGITAIPGSLAVDFYGGTNDGSNIMPDVAYAAESGTVVSVCIGTENEGIYVVGNNHLAYWHLIPGTNYQIGDVITAGSPIGFLVHGPFSDDCGGSSHPSDTYHLHFAFARPASGYLEIGGCVLTISTGLFSCNGSSIGVNGYLTNTGAISPPSGPTITPGRPTPTPGGPTPTPVPGGIPSNPVEGGQHIWDGFVFGFVNLIESIGQKYLPAHAPIGLSDYVDRVFSSMSGFAGLINASQIIYITPTVLIGIIILTMEMVRVLIIAYRWIIRLEPMP